MSLNRALTFAEQEMTTESPLKVMKANILEMVHRSQEKDATEPGRPVNGEQISEAVFGD